MPYKLRLMMLFISLAAGLLILISTPAIAETLVVTSTADVPDPPQLTLREAIAQAAPSDTICFDKSLDGQTITLNSYPGTLRIDKSLAITAASLRKGITIDSQTNTFPIITVFSNVVVSFNHLTITRGYTVQDGAGGIYNPYVNADIKLTNCTITNNTGKKGGGISSIGTLTLIGSVITNNRVNPGIHGGGGIYCYGSAANLTAIDSTISDNIANSNLYGGGIYCSGKQLTLKGCTVSGNRAYNYGGIYFYKHGVNNGDVDLENCTITDNVATSADGGIYLNAINLTVHNCTIYQNRAGLYAANDLNAKTLSLTNCTISENSGKGEGGINIETQGANNSGEIADCVIKDNTPNTLNFERSAIRCTASGEFRISNTKISGTIQGAGLKLTGFPGAHFFLDNCCMTGNELGIENFNFTGSTTQMERCVVSDNHSNDSCRPGGVWNRGNLVINESTIESNTAPVAAGIDNGNRCGSSADTSLVLNRCTVSNNTATAGHAGGIAGIYSGGRIFIRLCNCTVSGNTANSGNGGGIYFDAGQAVSQLIATATTISHNQAIGSGATGKGGGVFVVPRPNSTTTANNTLIAQNNDTQELAPDFSGSVMSEGYNLIGIIDGSNGWVDTDQTGDLSNPLDPAIGKLADNGGPTQTHALLKGSPAINTGNPKLAGTQDQRGILRDKAPDIGSFEFTNR